MKRKVTIRISGDTWLVLYVNRKPKTRYAAASFYAKDHSYQSVEEWVRKQEKLELVYR